MLNNKYSLQTTKVTLVKRSGSGRAQTCHLLQSGQVP